MVNLATDNVSRTEDSAFVRFRGPDQGHFLKVAFSVLLVLLVLHGVSEFARAQIGGEAALMLEKAVNFDRETNLPTLFNFSLLVLCAALLVLISFIEFRENGHRRWHWLVLAAVFHLMSFDEAAQLHERLSGLVNRVVETDGLLLYAWVVPVGVFVAVVGLAYIPFLRGLPKRVGRMILLAGGMYVLGALGMEMIAAYLESVDPGARGAMPWRIAMTLEETLEMSGLIVFASALIVYLQGATERGRSRPGT